MDIRFNILVVEDSSTLAAVVKYKLQENLNCNVVIAKNYEEAIFYLEESDMKFLVALSGLNLPDDPDGEVIKYLAKKRIPVIVMTSSLNKDTRKRLLSEHILGYVITEKIDDINYAVKLIDRIYKNKSIDILVVDDSATARFVIKNFLLERNYNIIEAKDGVDALVTLKQNSNVKLVITDYNMPKMDGFELISQIREKYNKEQIAIIGISGSDSGKLSVQFLKNGANDFLIKPFEAEEFHCRVEQSIENILNIEAINDLANRDYLTKMYNRRFFFDNGGKIYKNAKKRNKNLTVVMMDIDFFKKVNDTYGHSAGDDVLKLMSELLKTTFERKYMIPSRLGGEEFAILFENIEKEKVFMAMDNFRKKIQNTPCHTSDKQTINFTTSFGISSILGKNFDDFLNNADKMLYVAKENGRNRVEMDGEVEL